MLIGIGEPMPGSLGLFWNDALEPLPYETLLLEGELGRSAISSITLSGSDDCRDMPGICTREEFDP